MNGVVPAEIAIDEPLVASLVKNQFDLDVKTLTKVGEGFDNVVFLVNGKWAFRFPRRHVAIALLEHEMTVLPLLSGLLSVDIPTPKFLGTASEHFTYPFYGYQILPGTSGCSVRLTARGYELLAHDLGAFARELHAIDVKTFSHALSPVFDRLNFSELEKYFTSRMATVRDPYNLQQYDQKIGTILSHAESYDANDAQCFVHGDLYHRHVLFNEQNRLSGVIDWGDSCLGHPVVDLGIVFQFLPKKYHTHFFVAYGNTVDEHALAYARFLGLYYAIALLWYGHGRNDQDLIRTSLWTLGEL